MKHIHMQDNGFDVNRQITQKCASQKLFKKKCEVWHNNYYGSTNKQLRVQIYDQI